jgi:hypothetical protein
VNLIKTEFPWILLVKGKTRKQCTQRSIEVGHKAFKNPLVKWLIAKDEDDWIMGVQCKVYTCPIRV